MIKEGYSKGKTSLEVIKGNSKYASLKANDSWTVSTMKNLNGSIRISTEVRPNEKNKLKTIEQPRVASND